MVYYAAVTVAVAAATATAAWVLSSYLLSETLESQNSSSATESQNSSSATESQNRSSATVEWQNGSLETMQDPNCPHVEVNIGLIPVFDPETRTSLSGNEIRVDQHIIHGSEIHHTIHTQLDSIQASKAAVKISKRHSEIQSIKSYEDTGVQAGSKEVTTHRRQKNKQTDNQNSQKFKRKRKLKVDDNNQNLRHLVPKIHLQETIKIMSYNIWSIKYYKREKRIIAVSHLIEQHSPDIILLQEVTPEAYIYFQSCGWWEVYRCSIEEKQATKQIFCMVLSKLPVKKFFYKHFVNTKTCKGVSVAKFTSNPKKALTVATCHLKSPDGASTYDLERTSQAKEAIKLLKFSRNVVLGGDMNWDESTDGPFPLTKGWCDAWSDLKPEEDGYTYDTESNAMLGGSRFVVQKRLDRFVCRLMDFDMVDIEIVGTEAIKGVSYKSNGGKKRPLLPSDHYGLILTICAK